ncbi:hypothetical protein YPPY101_3152, partial [Yersinia pestis PY-101]
MPVIPAKL